MKYILLTLTILTMSCSNNNSDCIDKDCADYSSKAAAQADYDANPECRKDLDHDGDGKACEDFFNASPGNTGNNGCPQTANCGCSNKRKAECDNKCCKWIVGEGCKCRN